MLCVESRNIHGSRLLPYSHLLIMSLKRKLSGKSLSEKYEIAQLFKNGIKRAKIAKDFDIPSSTVYDVCKNVDHVIAEYKKGGNGRLMHSKPHSFDRVDRPLLEFFRLARQQVANKWSTSSRKGSHLCR